MTFTEIGQVAYDCWTMIPEHFPFVKLGAFVIMPNHVHGVIVIDKHEQTTSGCDAGDNVLLQQQQQWQQNKFGPQSQNLGSIIRGFKVGVTKYATAAAIPFGWQTRFNDRVIRNHDELMRIEQYINNNIENWNDDELYKEIK
jgi:REP element-mobilizing transposase RayT